MNIIAHKHLTYGACIVGLDTLLFATTNVRSAPSYAVIVGFLALAGTLWALLYGVISGLSLYGIRVKHKRRKALYISGLCSGLIALQSIGELTTRDIVVLAPLLAIGYGYSSYTKATRRNFEI